MKARTLPRLTLIAMLLAAPLAMADDAGVAWNDLNEDQQRVLQSFAENWDQLAPERQARLSKGAERWAGMFRDVLDENLGK